MSVIPLTIFCSLLLAGLFIVLFALEQRRRCSSAERDSLLPLADEQRHTVGPAGPGHDHAHDAHAGCGCRDGSRPPCAGCLKPSVPSAATPL